MKIGGKIINVQIDRQEDGQLQVIANPVKLSMLALAEKNNELVTAKAEDVISNSSKPTFRIIDAKE